LQQKKKFYFGRGQMTSKKIFTFMDTIVDVFQTSKCACKLDM